MMEHLLNVENLVALIQTYGYPGLFTLLVLGIVGLPIPDETLLTITGFLAFKGVFHLPYAYAVGFLGASGGITLSYVIGRFLGIKFIIRYGRKLRISPESMEKVQVWFHRWGKWSLTFGYYIPGVRHFTAIVAGSSRLYPPTFAFYAYLGALIWSASFITAGYLFGEAWSRMNEVLHRVLIIAIAVIAVIGLFVHLIRRMKRRRKLSKDS